MGGADFPFTLLSGAAYLPPIRVVLVSSWCCCPSSFSGCCCFPSYLSCGAGFPLLPLWAGAALPRSFWVVMRSLYKKKPNSVLLGGAALSLVLLGGPARSSLFLWANTAPSLPSLGGGVFLSTKKPNSDTQMVC